MKRYRDIVGDAGSDVIGQITEQQARLRERLSTVSHSVGVMSGKGGVGKSCLTVNLAAALSHAEKRVGVLDADLNGPSIAKMLGIREQLPQLGEDGMGPIIGPAGIRAVSLDLFLPSDETPVTWEAPTQREAYVWRGTMEMAALRQLLADTAWGELDVLLIDLPPGTDRIANLGALLPDLEAAVMVTIPAQVSQLVVKRSFSLAREHFTRARLGLVENMRGYLCPGCGTLGPLFPDGQVEALAREQGAEYLGAIPFDPRIPAASDEGRPFVLDYPDSAAGKALAEVTTRLEQLLVEPGSLRV